MVVEFAGTDSNCTFFDGTFNLGTWNNSAAAVVNQSGATPTVTKSGSATQSGGNWRQKLNVTFSAAGSAKINYYLKLTNNAGDCTGSSTHVGLDNSDSQNNGDFANIGARDIPMPAGDVLELPQITVKKYVQKDDGSYRLATAGEWSFSLDGQTSVATNSSGEVLYTSVTPNGAHTVTESTKSGYVLDKVEGTNCVLSTTANSATATAASSTTTPTDAICKFYNRKVVNPTIKLIKEVVNPYGGTTASVNDFGISINGTTMTSGSTFQAQVGQSYTIDEAGKAGYEFSSITGTGCPTTKGGKTVTLTEGQNITCTIKNTAIQPKLIIKKHVINDNGGSKTAANFTMNVTGTNVSSSSFAGNENGTQVTLDVGGYSVDEQTATGYAKTIGEGCSGSIALGETKECTITNDDVAPALTLIKKLIKDNGGTANATDWTLTATGTKGTNLSGKTGSEGVTSGSTFKADTYTLGETGGPTGYTSEGWECTAGVEVSEANTITLANGVSTTCTITNNDDAPALTLVKNLVDNFNSGVSATAWTLTATGPTVVSGKGGATDSNIKQGDYTFSESGPTEGFTAGDSWTCVEASSPNTNISVGLNEKLSIALGQQFTCTVTNTAQPAKLTVKKVVDNSNGGTKSADDFSFSVNKGNETWFNENGINNLDLAKGTYTVTETQANQNGYETSYDNCTEVAISNGETETCTITNTAKAPHLTLYKEVINNNSGQSSPSDWTLAATPAENKLGATKISGNGEDGVVDVAAKAGVTYTLTESGPDGYTQGDWECYGGQLDGIKLTLALGEDVECWITNDDEAHPGIHVYKYGPDTAHEGDTVTYTFWVHNSGDTYLDDLSVIDDIAGEANCFGVTSLDAGEWALCSATYTVPENQTDDVVNTVEACAVYYGDYRWDEKVAYNEEWAGEEVCATDTHTLDVLHPAIKVVKTGPATAKPGEVVTYTFTVTNTGDEPLDSVTVADNIAGAGVYKSGDTNEDGVLDTTETWVYSAQYTIPADAGGKQIVNTAKVCGTELVGEDQEESVNVYSMLKLNREESDAVAQPEEDDALTVCATDSHTTTVEKPQELVNTGAGNVTVVGYILAATMLGGVFLANRRQIKNN